MKNEHTITIPASTEYLNRVRGFVAELAKTSGFSDEDVEEIRLAVDEACTNVIKHAYNNNSTGQIKVKVTVNGRQLDISLFDSGNAFDPETYTSPNLQERVRRKKRGGMGIYLIRKFMDKVEYRRSDACNEICMTKIKN